MNLELETELSLNYTLHWGKFKDRCVYASYKVEWLIGAVDLDHHEYYFLKSFFKCHLKEAGEGRLVLYNSVVI